MAKTVSTDPDFVPALIALQMTGSLLVLLQKKGLITKEESADLIRHAAKSLAPASHPMIQTVKRLLADMESQL